jgi:hypothetical protein
MTPQFLNCDRDLVGPSQVGRDPPGEQPSLTGTKLITVVEAIILPGGAEQRRF